MEHDATAPYDLDRLRGGEQRVSDGRVEAIRKAIPWCAVTGSHIREKGCGRCDACKARAALDSLAAEHAPIPDTYACERCGRRDGLDAVCPNDVWRTISWRDDGGGVLCLWCIDSIAADKGLTFSVALHFAGKAITGTSESDATQDFIARLVEQRDQALAASDREAGE